MSKFISIIVMAAGVLCSAAYILSNVFLKFMSMPLCIFSAAAFDIILIMLVLMISIMNLIAGRLSKMSRNLTEKEDK